MIITFQAAALDGSTQLASPNLQTVDSRGGLQSQLFDGTVNALPLLGQISNETLNQSVGRGDHDLLYVAVAAAPAGTTYIDYWIGIGAPGDVASNQPRVSNKLRINLALGEVRGPGLLVPQGHALFFESDGGGGANFVIDLDVTDPDEDRDCDGAAYAGADVAPPVPCTARISTFADFPTPVGGIVTLATGVTYEVCGAVVIPDDIEFAVNSVDPPGDVPQTAIVGVGGRDSAYLIGNVDGALISLTNGGLFSNITVINNSGDAAASAITIENSKGPGRSVFISSAKFRSLSGDACVLGDVTGVQIVDTILEGNVALRFAGDIAVVSLDSVTLLSAGLAGIRVNSAGVSLNQVTMSSSCVFGGTSRSISFENFAATMGGNGLNQLLLLGNNFTDTANPLYDETTSADVTMPSPDLYADANAPRAVVRSPSMLFAPVWTAAVITGGSIREGFTYLIDTTGNITIQLPSVVQDAVIVLHQQAGGAGVATLLAAGGEQVEAPAATFGVSGPFGGTDGNTRILYGDLSSGTPTWRRLIGT